MWHSDTVEEFPNVVTYDNSSVGAVDASFTTRFALDGLSGFPAIEPARISGLIPPNQANVSPFR